MAASDIPTPIEPESVLNERHIARLMRLALEQSYIAVVITDADLVTPGPYILWANRRFCTMTGYALEELVGQSPRLLQGALSDRTVLDRLHRNLIQGEPFEGETINYRKDGSPYRVEWTISPVINEQGQPVYFVSFQKEVTQEYLDQQQRLLHSTALEQTADGVVITDPEGVIQYVNNAFEVHTGYGRDEAVGAKPNLVRSGVHDDDFYRELWTTIKDGRAFRATFTNRKRSGELYYEEKTITPVHDESGAIVSFVSTGKDITERVEMEERLKRMATTDALTELPNRLHLEQLLEREVERSERYGQPLALIMLDIDHFKQVNDDHGHEAGDDVLKEFARTIRENIRQSDVVARWGGEEFMLLAPQTDHDEAMTLAEKVRTRIAETDFPVPTAVTASFGAASLNAGETPKQLVKRADVALYQAKESGRNQVVSAD